MHAFNSYVNCLSHWYFRIADINECNTTTPVCGQNSICANTEGGFECRCASGYQEISAQCQGR